MPHSTLMTLDDSKLSLGNELTRKTTQATWSKVTKETSAEVCVSYLHLYGSTATILHPQ